MKTIPSPAYLLYEDRLVQNLHKIAAIQQATGATFILALKAFDLWEAFDTFKPYIKTCTASSLHEAKLCFEEFGAKAHTYAPAYLPHELDEVLRYSSHLSFNSLTQYHQHAAKAQAANVSIGLRINPNYSDVTTELYNPCAPNSRLGINSKQVPILPKGVEGLHFHSLCESPANSTAALIAQVSKRCHHLLQQAKWVNFGGGHLVTKADYDTDTLIAAIQNFKANYPHLSIYFEPGSAFLWETGDLITTVLDIVDSRPHPTAILDVSFTCHMPDTLEMPYRPSIDCGDENETTHPHQYQLGGVSCLAGDYLAAYSFEQPLTIGQRITFKDMLHYTTVKTTHFNGVTHPNVYIKTTDNSVRILREYGYHHYKK